MGVYLVCDRVGFDRHGRVLPCAKMLADLHARADARCPHPDAARRAAFAAARLAPLAPVPTPQFYDAETAPQWIRDARRRSIARGPIVPPVRQQVLRP